jgi:hypothetical protein
MISGIIPAMKTAAPRRKTVARKATARGRAASYAVREPLLQGVAEAGALFDLDGVIHALGMTKAQLAETAGLGRDTLQKSARAQAPKTRARIGEMLEILARVEAWAGGKPQALAWYRAQPISALDGRTAEALVKTGKAAAVRDYLDHIALGGFA